jgi:hypothetical protein
LTFRPSCGSWLWPEPLNAAQYVGEQVSGNGYLGHLEGNVAPVAHDLSTNLDQFVSQAGQRPVPHGIGQGLGSQEVPEIVGECVQLQADGIVGELATGQSRPPDGVLAFRDLAELRAADIFQPDLAIYGGITEGMRIAAIAAAYQIRLAPHLWGGAPMFAAGLHLCAASPAAHIIEYSLGANPMLHDLVEEDFPCINGHVEFPERPGLGITVRQNFVEKYAVT